MLLGCVLLLMAPAMMVVMILAASVGGPRWNSSDVRIISLVFSVPLLCLIGLGILGLVAAANGLRSTGWRRRSVSLSVVGLIVCVVALLFSLINLIACFLIAEDLMHIRR